MRKVIEGPINWSRLQRVKTSCSVPPFTKRVSSGSQTSGSVCRLEHSFNSRLWTPIRFPNESGSVCRVEHPLKSRYWRPVRFPTESGSGAPSQVKILEARQVPNRVVSAEWSTLSSQVKYASCLQSGAPSHLKSNIGAPPGSQPSLGVEHPLKSRYWRPVRFPTASGSVCRFEHQFKLMLWRLVKFPTESQSVSRVEHPLK